MPKTSHHDRADQPVCGDLAGNAAGAPPGGSRAAPKVASWIARTSIAAPAEDLGSGALHLGVHGGVARWRQTAPTVRHLRRQAMIETASPTTPCALVRAGSHPPDRKQNCQTMVLMKAVFATVRSRRLSIKGMISARRLRGCGFHPYRPAETAGADVCLSPNGSPYYRKKFERRNVFMEARVAENRPADGHLNMVGRRTTRVFDGAPRDASRQGRRQQCRCYERPPHDQKSSEGWRA